MFEALAKWSHERLLLTLALSYVAILEGMSWLTSGGPLCIVEATPNGCPTLHAFFITSMATMPETVGHDWIIAISAVVTAIFTGTLWWSTRTLWKAGEIHSERQLRAYLGVQTGKIISHDGGNTFIVEITIINSGQTPARRVTHSIAAELQILHGPPLDFLMPNRQPGEWFLAPNTTFTFVQDIAIGGASGTGTIDAGQRTIFTWGRVDFIDAFDRPQYIEFRYRNYRPIRRHDGTVMRTVGWELEPADQGNTCT
jgi:hypothetical protein